MRKRPGDGGMATVELVVLLPLILFVIFAPIILNLAVWSKVVVTDSAREAARYVGLDLGPPEQKVAEVLRAGNLDPARVQSVTTTDLGDYVQVTVTYRQPTILPGLPALMGGRPWDQSVTLTSKSVFKKEVP